MKTKIFIVLAILFSSILVGKSIYVDLSIDIKSELLNDLKKNDYSVKRFKKNFYNRISSEFSSENNVIIKNKSLADFLLTGTIYIDYFMKPSSSYSILFEIEDMKVQPAIPIRPDLYFKPFTSRDNTGGVAPADKLNKLSLKSESGCMFYLSLH